MRISWLIGALVCFIVGVGFTITIIGALIGIPLILISVLFLVLGIVLPEPRKVVHVHHYHGKKRK